mmetsp:Transcript_30992/g.69772  ORF Transcript_30992/g.69772 Transcript_30992/m.69772 type:complete len:351 (-) Transcript_30992:31-1083(-)
MPSMPPDDVLVKQRRPKLPRVASETSALGHESFSMPPLPAKHSAGSKSSPSLRRDDQVGRGTHLPMLSPSGGRGSSKVRSVSHRHPKQAPKAQDLRLQAMSLCKRHQMSFSEVMSVLEALQHANPDKSGLPMERFRSFMQRALYVEHVNDDLLRSAYETSVQQGIINVDEFLNWCKAHMFSVVAGLTADSEHVTSLKLVQQVAHRCGLRVSDVDKIYTHFQKFDLDKSGEIEFVEFEAMIKSLIGVSQTTDLPKERLQRFWKEMDSDGNGIVDFGEFAAWYMKYFPTSAVMEESGGGVLEAFYASYSPDVQRSNCLDEQSQEEILIRQESHLSRDVASFSKGPAKGRTKT